MADAAGVDNGNLGRWLRGGTTLSEARAMDVLEVLGLPHGKPDTTHVHMWRLTNVVMVNLVPALRLYFTDGAEVAKAPWAVPGFKTAWRAITGKAPPCTVYALTDGKVRAVLRLSGNLLLQPENHKEFLTWRDGEESKSILGITESDTTWISGTPTVHEFDTVWHGKTAPETEADLIEAAIAEGFTIKEAIGIIRDEGRRRRERGER